MADFEQLKFVSESLNEAVGLFRTSAEGTFETVNDRLETASQQQAEIGTEQAAVAEQLQNVLSQIDDVRTQDLAAKLVMETGVVEGVEMAESDVEQLQSFAGQIEAYVTEVNEINNQFMEGQIGQNEATEAYNELLDTSIERLNERQEALGLEQQQVDALEGSFEDMNQTQRRSGSMLGEFAGIGGGLAELLGDFKGFGKEAGQKAKEGLQQSGALGGILNFAMEFGGRLKSLILNPIGGAAFAIGGTLALITDRFLELNQASEQFLQATGASAEKAEGLRQNVARLAPELRMAGLEESDLIDSTVQLTEQFGSAQNAAQSLDSNFRGINDPVKALNQEVIAVAGRLRMSGEEATELITDFETIATSTGTNRQNLQASAMQAAELAGVAPKSVMSDIANSSEELAKFSGLSGEELATAAAQARNLGTNINEVAGLQENILSDAAGFVQNMEKVNTLSPELGLDTGAFFRAAQEGPEAITAELEEQLGGMNFGELDYYTKDRLSNALGMSAAQLSKISERAKEAEVTTAELSDKVQEGEASFERLFEVTGGQTALTTVKNQFSALFATIGESMIPVFKGLANAIGSVIGPINSAMQSLKDFSKPLFNVVGALLGGAGLVAAFKATGMALSATGLSSLLPSISLGLGGLASSAGAAATSAVAAAGGLSALAAPITALAATLFYVRKPLMDVVMGLGSGLMTVVEPVTGLFYDMLDALKPVMTLLNPLASGFNTLFDAFVSGVPSASWIVPFFKTVGSLIGDVLIFPLRTAVSTIDIAVQSIRLFGNAFGFLFDVITGDFGPAMTNLMQIFDGLGNIIGAIVSPTIGLVSDIASSFTGKAASKIESSIYGFFTSLPGKIATWLSGSGSAIVDALTPNMSGLESGMQQATSTIASYIPFSPAETGPLSEIGNADITGEIANNAMDPEPMEQKMQVATEAAVQATAEPQQIENSNRVSVEQPSEEGSGIGEQIMGFMEQLTQSQKQVAAAAQGQPDVYMDGKRVTDRLRSGNNKNAMKMDAT